MEIITVWAQWSGLLWIIRKEEVLKNDFGGKNSIIEEKERMVSGAAGGKAGYIQAVCI